MSDTTITHMLFLLGSVACTVGARDGAFSSSTAWLAESALALLWIIALQLIHIKRNVKK